MSDEEIINTIVDSLENYALSDIKFLKKNGKPIAAMILGMCFIEQISHFIYGPAGKDKDKSMKFINEYLNHGKDKLYSATDLVDILRNKLVHNYTISDRRKKFNKYALNYDNPKSHLHDEDGLIYINTDTFVDDLEQAFNLYKERLSAESRLKAKALEQFRICGILIHRVSEISL